MRRHIVRTLVVVFVVAWMQPAGAVHLFPSFEGDPGGDCGTGLAPTPAERDASMVLEGFFFFDEADGDSTVEVESGSSVTWEWIQYCHSVTSTSVPEGAEPFTTSGGPGSATGPAEGQDELLKPDGDNITFTHTFTVPGTYEFACVHHASVGMTGTVEVTGSAPEQDGGDGTAEGGGGSGGGEGGRGETDALAAPAALPATGGGTAAGLVLAGLAVAGLLATRRHSTASPSRATSTSR